MEGGYLGKEKQRKAKIYLRQLSARYYLCKSHLEGKSGERFKVFRETEECAQAVVI